MYATDSALFISDLHLTVERPPAIAAFENFLCHEALGVSDLFILGDLFDAWIGDDQEDECIHRIDSAMRKLCSTGTRLWLMGGNRDFMLGELFSDRVGATLLSDPTIIALGDELVLLCHGDTLCNQAVSYVRWRNWSRNPKIRALFLRLPKHWRNGIGRLLREHSKKKQLMYGHGDPQQAAIDDSDIISAAVVNALLGEHGAQHMVHGHTHRPAIHPLAPNGGRRVVLGAWDEGQPIRYLRYSDGDWQLDSAAQLL